MSDIRPVLAADHAAKPPAERTPARDFAAELIKHDGGGNGQTPHELLQSPVSPVPQRGVVAVSTEKVLEALSEPPSSSKMGQTLAELSLQTRVAVQPTGITELLPESRVFGVHLLASTYLSMVVTTGNAGLPPAAASGQQAPIDAPCGQDQPPAFVPSSMEGKAHDVVPDRQAMATVDVLANVHEERIESRAVSSPVEATASSTDASVVFWPERTLRLTRQTDGSAVLWLRDYRATDEHVRHLVESFVRGTQVGNRGLGRVVVNGREVWNSRETNEGEL